MIILLNLLNEEHQTPKAAMYYLFARVAVPVNTKLHGDQAVDD